MRDDRDEAREILKGADLPDAEAVRRWFVKEKADEAADLLAAATFAHRAEEIWPLVAEAQDVLRVIEGEFLKAELKGSFIDD